MLLIEKFEKKYYENKSVGLSLWVHWIILPKESEWKGYDEGKVMMKKMVYEEKEKDI